MRHLSKSTGLIFSLGLIIILTSGCAWHVQKIYPPEWSGVPEAKVPEWSDRRAPQLEPMIRKHCASFVAEGKGIGLTVAVVSGTNMAIMGFGRSPATSQEPPRDDTLYEIGSLTKTFTALALAREIDRGDLRLDQPLAEILPNGIQLPKDARLITLRHLTTHTSGFPRMPAHLSFWRVAPAMFSLRNPYGDYTEDQFREDISKVHLDSNPGTTCEYSNFGMGVLGYALSKKAGLSYETYIKREICEPLGMLDTTITLTTNQAARFAQGYFAAERHGKMLKAVPSCPWDLPDCLSGAGALRSSASDMLKYLLANMRPEGSLAKPIRVSHRELYREPGHIAIGMNWILSSNKNHATIIWHNGRMGGTSSYLGFSKDGRAGVVILSNVSTDETDDLGRKILNELTIPAVSTAQKAALQPAM